MDSSSETLAAAAGKARNAVQTRETSEQASGADDVAFPAAAETARGRRRNGRRRRWWWGGIGS
ncbi:hypothetical protein PR202_gb04817 [Eleusine coracana subsp. coracana]|uniref:Uncharacterized protein n=1 Tax=Eleusine coracana subsp. coracana TaxID=191504 RepID=A0AAV5E3U4_ELECO|nr:hypothetical protein PR202_gb04817 [Eleusine coracana subsp. coracana]